MKKFFTVLVCVALSISQCSGNDDWCYEDSTCGPETWPGACNSAFAMSQSPINLVSNQAIFSADIQLQFSSAYSSQNTQFYVKNDKHSVFFSLPGNEELIVTGNGALEGGYKFAEMHFHWGPRNELGSEHTLNGKAYPLELHLVHHSTRYATLGEAVADANYDSLAVLGIFFDVSPTDNPSLEPLIRALNHVKLPSPSPILVNSTSSYPLILTSLLPQDLSLFTYTGSLTTPECQEIVLWNVFATPVSISERQLWKFRELLGPNGTPIGNNFRPTQSVGSRSVYFHPQLASLPGDRESSANCERFNAILAIITCMMIYFRGLVE